jgi:hypothetical protein
VLFDPQRIANWVARIGLTAGAAPATPPTPPTPPEAFEADAELGFVEKCLHLFMRATELNEQSMRKRFGTRAAKFFDDVLPQLLSHGVIKRVQYSGSGQQQRFELGGPLQQFTDVLAKSEGRFTKFLAEWDAR